MATAVRSMDDAIVDNFTQIQVSPIYLYVRSLKAWNERTFQKWIEC